MKSGRNYIFFYGSRIIGAVLLLLIYLYGLRPLRSTITQHIVLPVISSHYNNPLHPYSIVNKGTALTITFQWNDDLKTIRYQPQLGFFFLIAFLALIFITMKPKWYLWLAAFHILAMLLVIVILYFSRTGWYPGFIAVDFLITYLIPGLTFMYVVFVYKFRNTN